MKKNWVWLVLILAVVILAIFWLMKNSDSAGQNFTLTPEGTSSPNPIAVKPKTIKPVVPGAANYTQLVEEYEGRRVQFDEKCQMTPPNPTFKNGTKIMLDNRSASARAITVGSQKYNVMGYGYQLLTLSGKDLPQTIGVNCGALVNVGQILLQALILNK